MSKFIQYLTEAELDIDNIDAIKIAKYSAIEDAWLSVTETAADMRKFGIESKRYLTSLYNNMKPEYRTKIWSRLYSNKKDALPDEYKHVAELYGKGKL